MKGITQNAKENTIQALRKSMHILIIPSEHFMTTCSPCGGIFQSHQAKILSGSGEQVGILNPGIISPRFLLRKYNYERFEQTSEYVIFRKYTSKLYPIRYLKPHNLGKIYQKLGVKLYDKYVRQFGTPDIIHAHNIRYAGFVAYALHKKYGIPYVITEHGSRFLTKKNQKDNITDLSVIKNASCVAAVSLALAEAMHTQLYTNNIRVLPNVIDPLFINTPLKKNTHVNQRAFTFLHVGSFDKNKNQIALLRAFAENFKGENVFLRIGGTGQLRKYLEKAVQFLGIEQQVTFLGHVSREKIIEEMQYANCFVLSSLHETFGVVLIEALASGTPIISTSSGGPNHIVTEAVGLLVPTGETITLLKKAMLQMVKNAQMYDPYRLRSICNDHFGQAAFLKRVKLLYHEALNMKLINI